MAFTIPKVNEVKNYSYVLIHIPHIVRSFFFFSCHVSVLSGFWFLSNGSEKVSIKRSDFVFRKKTFFVVGRIKK